MSKHSTNMKQIPKTQSSWIGALMQTTPKASLALLLLLFSLVIVQQAQAQTCYGVSATGGTNPANAVGAHNGNVGITTTPIIVDMGTTPLSSGTVITFYAIGDNTFGTPAVLVSTSLDGITYTATQSKTVGATIPFLPVTYTLTASARYIKFTTSGLFPTDIDAVEFTCAAPSCAAPVLTATATQVTCTSGTANSDGKLTLATFDANAKKVDYSVGSTYTGVGFASATTITGTSNFVVVNTLANPANDVMQPYTIRVFCDATTYTDKTVVMTHKQCLSADLSVSVSPATQTGNQGEYLTYTVTVTNAGPDAAPTVEVTVPMPDPAATLLSATATLGSYNATTKIWTIGTLSVGSQTLTFTVKVN